MYSLIRSYTVRWNEEHSHVDQIADSVASDQTAQYAQGDLKLHCTHMSEDPKAHDPAHLVFR